uniref:Tyr recombinase domain-containing protein n=1 Tax=Schistosoma curassoni TaxID=6186 RepID=A0A183JC36_9TREM
MVIQPKTWNSGISDTEYLFLETHLNNSQKYIDHLQLILVTFGYLRKGEAYITYVSDVKTCFLRQYPVVIVKQHKKNHVGEFPYWWTKFSGYSYKMYL